MRSLQSSLSTRLQSLKESPKSKARSERGELIGIFLETLNADRKPPFKPLTAARVGMLLSPIKTKDLHAFLADCKYASNFSKYFWWCFKQAKK